MVPESHLLTFPTSADLRAFLGSAEFNNDVVQKLKDQYVVEVTTMAPKQEMTDGKTVEVECLLLRYTRNNAGGLKDAIDFLTVGLVSHGLNASTIKGAIPRPKSDSFEDSMPFFDSKLLQRAEPPVSTESPTRAHFGQEENEHRSFLDKLRRPSGMASFSSFLERRKNGSTSSASNFFKQTSSNASKASLASMESRDSGHRNPWNDSGVELEHDGHSGSWGSFGNMRPPTASSLSTPHEGKFPFGAGNTSTTSLGGPLIPGLGGDITPKIDVKADGQLSQAGNERKTSEPNSAISPTTTAPSNAK